MANVRYATLYPCILFGTTIAIFSTNIYVPAMPAMQKAFGTSASLVKLSITFYLLSLSLTQLLYGPLSERFGRKKTMLFGLGLSVVGTLMSLFAPNIFLLIIGRFIQGAGLGACNVTAFATIRDLFEGDEISKFNSRILMGSATSLAIGPALGGYLTAWFGWRGCFAFLLAYSLVAFFMMIFWFPETKKQGERCDLHASASLKCFAHILSNPIFLGYAIASSLTFAGQTAYYAATPFLHQNTLQGSAVQFGWLTFFVALGYWLGAFTNPYILKHLGRHRSLVVGIAILFLSGFAMFAFTPFGILSAWAFVLPFFFFMFGAAITYSNALAGAYAPFAKIAGHAASSYGSFQTIASFLATGIIAFSSEKNQLPLSLILLFAGLFAYWTQYWAFKRATQKCRTHL